MSRANSVVRFLAGAALLTVCGLGATGCQGYKFNPPPPVNGSVVWEDGGEAHELGGATLEFQANGSVVAKTQLQSDGTFALDTALPSGTCKVRIVPDPAKAPPPTKGTTHTMVLDPKYEKFETSGLTASQTSEAQNIVLKVNGRKVPNTTGGQKSGPSWD